MRQRVHLPAVDLFAARLELLANAVGEGEIHVVAAEQDVIAHRNAHQLEGAARFDRRDRGEVGGASTDVDDQNDIAHLDFLAP
jgi:hypothetical protein